MKLSQLKILPQLLEASSDFYDPIWKDTRLHKEDIRIDPTRAHDVDVYDAIMGICIVEAARQMVEEKKKHEKLEDPDDEDYTPFDESQAELADKAYDLMRSMLMRLKDDRLSSKDVEEVVAQQFKSLPKTYKEIKDARKSK